MSNALTIDFAREGEAGYRRIFARSPQLTSLAAGWDGICFGYDYMPPGETTEVFSLQHTLAIFTHTNQSQIAERSIDGKFHREQVANGNMVLVPARIGCRSRWFDWGGVMFFGFDSIKLAQAVDEATDQTELLPQFALNDPLVYHIGLSLKTVLERDGTASRLYAESLSNALIVHLLQHYSAQRPSIRDYTNGLSQSRLRCVVDYIQAHLDQDLSLGELAAIAKMSPRYFLQLFKQSTGVTPHQFVIRARVARAKELLIAGRLPIAEVAKQVGFVDQSHLHRHCKKLLGITPKMIQNS
ncbi:AraC family transcriptional regulator [Leptolyngbya sp. FACHB-17]|uniref:helix-turn-helix domain-containing protein n=1 Tax=unclassified Leptolyngbya TaxID=2650499 RepID=UPI001680E3A5|nr:AraC family transcriptional regulator [Leptolyngbya sp. FACHB-17]MBD2079930.1 helix-turn-helix transcriptional regulator [Leptolyngbya sp. FACHB-17]